MMKILLITDNHTPTGGAEKYFFTLKSALKKMPEIEVYSVGFGPATLQGADFFILKNQQSNAGKMIWRMLFHPIVYFKLRRYIKKIRPDVIHLHNIKQYSISVISALKHYPVVQTIHDYGAVCPVAHNIHQDKMPCETGLRLSCFWQHRVKYNLPVYLALVASFFQLRKHVKRRVKKFLAPSPQLVDYLKRNQFTDATYIQPFINKKTTYSFEQRQPTHFLFAGNLGTHKGVDILLNEFAIARQMLPSLTLTIAGSGPEAHSIQEKIKQLGLENNVTFIGWQNHLDKHYAACTAVIFPSIWMEAFGLVITDAMSFARPVIGSNRGSPPWLIEDNETGLIFDPLKTGDLAEKMLKLANNELLAKKLGEKAFAKLHTLADNEDTLKTLITAYQQAITK